MELLVTGRCDSLVTSQRSDRQMLGQQRSWKVKLFHYERTRVVFIHGGSGGGANPGGKCLTTTQLLFGSVKGGDCSAPAQRAGSTRQHQEKTGWKVSPDPSGAHGLRGHVVSNYGVLLPTEENIVLQRFSCCVCVCILG